MLNSGARLVGVPAPVAVRHGGRVLLRGQVAVSRVRLAPRGLVGAELVDVHIALGRVGCSCSGWPSPLASPPHPISSSGARC